MGNIQAAVNNSLYSTPYSIMEATMTWLLFLFACGDKTDTDNRNANQNPDGSVQSIALSELNSRVAEGICEALLNCCDDESQALYFYNYLENESLSAQHDYLPPNAALNPETCPSIMNELLSEVWLGSWKSQAEAGLVSYNPDEAFACLQELQNASCGEEMRSAIFDGECFGYSAPSGGDSHRRMFERTHTSDQTCQPLADGFGGLYYGSCDPSTHFCCVPDENFDGCNPYPVPNLEGTCTPASAEGEICSSLPPVQLCQSGLECDFNTGSCVAISRVPLQLGETCYEASNYLMLGDCENSWCDLFGTGKCEDLVANDGSCLLGESCESGYCDPVMQICTEDPLCVRE